MSILFSPLTLRGLTLHNRIVVSPMCQYSSQDGYANDWHLVHLGSRAVGGAGLVFTEAAAIEPEGRISPQDLGLWKDEHSDMLARIVRFIQAQGRAAGIQIAHAGRKGSTLSPFDGTGKAELHQGGWIPLAPSAIAFDETYPQPTEMKLEDIKRITASFAASAKRALAAGFDVLEVHGAHGYLVHEFLSPLTNKRHDAYGGNFENRIRFLCEIISAVRAVWPEHLPLFLRISASDWVEGGWTIDDSVQLAVKAKALGIDVVDASSGGIVPDAKIAVKPLYQVPFAEQIRRQAEIPTGAVGLITQAHEAEEILRSGQADLIFLAREELRTPYWPLNAAHTLQADMAWPVQYDRAKPRHPATR